MRCLVLLGVFEKECKDNTFFENARRKCRGQRAEGIGHNWIVLPKEVWTVSVTDKKEGIPI
jgi:hypothetical protein